MNYDLLVIGNERAGLARAVEAAQSGRRVAVIENSLPLPSLDQMRVAAECVVAQSDVTMAAFKAEVSRLMRCDLLADQAELDCLGIHRISGAVRFVSATEVEAATVEERCRITAREIVVACGTRSLQPQSLHVDGRLVLTVESLLALADLPKSAVIVGAGETGISAAIVLATLGVEVTVVDEHASMFDVCGVFDESFESIQDLNIAFRLGDEVIGTQLRPDLQVAVRLGSGRSFTADVVLVCVGNAGNTDGLELEQAGVGLDEHGRLWCNAAGETWASTISAVGSVMGFRRPRNNVVGLSV